MPPTVNPEYNLEQPFITNEVFLKRYDWRWVAKNVLDGATANTSAALPTKADLEDEDTEAGSVLYECIFDASEMVMAAAAVGARYTVEDLMPSGDYPGGGRLLRRIVADLTMGFILQRRGRAIADEQSLSGPYNEAVAYVEQLRRGERIFFQVPDVPEAGLPDVAAMDPIPGLNSQLLTQDAYRYFGCGPGVSGNPYPYTG